MSKSSQVTKIIVTGSLIIYENDKWLPVYQSFQFKEVNKKMDESVNYIYNWVTETGTIHLGDFMTRDLLEIHDVSYHKKFTLESIL